MSPTNPREPRSKASRSFALPALAGLALLLLVYELHGFAGVHTLLGDFQAFRCAGSAIIHGGDPYRSAALAACEHAHAPWNLYSAPAGVIVPAPLPPYALLMFVPLALLSYPVAACVWFGVLCGCIVAGTVLLARVLNVELPAVCWMLLLPATVLWLPFGEATPVALFGAVLAARALQTRKWRLAAVGLVLLALEPHVAAAAWICVAIGIPRARIPLAVAGAALIAASFAVHPGALFEYAARVLPIHALAEVPRPTQYSATWLFAALGASPAAALQAGSATYVLAAIAGAVIAFALRRRWNDASVLIFAPMATAVAGGTFVHVSQIALALPFAALLAARESRLTGAAAALACGTLAVPWLQGDQTQSIVLIGTAVAAAIVLALSRNATLALTSLVAGALFAALLVAAHARPPHATHAVRTFPIAAAAGEYASAAWGRYIWQNQSSATLADWLGKAPTWLALLLLVGSGLRAAAYKEPVVAIGVHEAPASP